MTKLLAFFILLICAPLVADEESMPFEDSVRVEDPSTFFYRKKFDRLKKDLQRVPMIIPIPEQRSEFERQMGILPAPAPGAVEPNGIVLEADPTVDLEMIYPKATRDKIVKVKRKKWQRPQPHFLE